MSQERTCAAALTEFQQSICLLLADHRVASGAELREALVRHELIFYPGQIRGALPELKRAG